MGGKMAEATQGFLIERNERWNLFTGEVLYIVNQINSQKHPTLVHPQISHHIIYNLFNK